ncbi:E3 ubiquitin ligase BIG BROTHER-related-like [Asparagus officinalis]|uniref:E3 ubiquitin ligase BIG BROTHER-related-like n=1 Tax=Asparagus officinalis TaxID=4686 RepID=UPI00098DF1DA|nr:E3 ubiquitin ligase BIG BROTHER-related-like [Asparagus officinalis]
MDDAKENAAIERSATGESPNPSAPSAPGSASDAENPKPNPSSRTPFTSLGQLDADLALARALQEQERAYMMLRMEGRDGGGSGSSESGSYVYEDEFEGDEDYGGADEDNGSTEGSDYGEDAFDVNEEELNPADFESDEAFARALQDAEEREVAVRLMGVTGLNDWVGGSLYAAKSINYGTIVAIIVAIMNRIQSGVIYNNIIDLKVSIGNMKIWGFNIQLRKNLGSNMTKVLNLTMSIMRAINLINNANTCMIRRIGVDKITYGNILVSYESRNLTFEAWQDVDPDELSYEELIALGEVVGTERRGLSVDTIASLPSVTYKAQSSQDANTDQCVICRLDYEEGDSLVELSCKHLYHPECINQWLQINKVCPICSCEVSTSSGQ